MFAYILYGLLIILYIYAVYQVVLLVTSEQHNPIRTLGWAVVLLFIPAIGLGVYVAFGRNERQEKRILKLSIRSKEQTSGPLNLDTIRQTVEEDIATTKTDNAESVFALMRLLYANGRSLVYPQNRIEILARPKETFDRLFADLEAATDHIHIEFYIIDNDVIGNQLRQILERKARQGLRVRVIYDYWGSYSIDRRYKKSMREAGVKFHAFFPPEFPFVLRHINNRNHRKVVVVDGKVAYTGGLNIADRYRTGNTLGVWRDTMVRLEGPVVHGLQETFLGDWYFIDHKKHQKRRYFPQADRMESERNFVQIVDSGPDTQYRNILHGICQAIATARNYIYIQTPYFMPPGELEEALRMASLRGVNLKILIPESSDTSMAQLSNASYLETMMESGAEIYWYKGGFLHSKAIVIDDYISTVGTSNMDFRSYEQNFEVNAFIYDLKTAATLKAAFENDLKNAEKVDLETWKQRSTWQKVKESFSRLFSPAM